MPKKEEKKGESIVEKFKRAPKRMLSEVEKQLIFILIEKAKIQREHSLSILNKGFVIFLSVIVLGYMSRYYDVVPQIYINLLFIFGVFVLIFTMVAYELIISREEKTLDDFIENFLK